MPTLDRIEIEGFKSIRKADLDLGPVNVLIGANGAGKSNFISVFALLQRMMEGRLQFHIAQAGGADALLHFGRKQTPRMQLWLNFSPQGTAYGIRLAPSATNSLFPEEELWGSTNRRIKNRTPIAAGTGQRS
jgi:predicted ATPase